MHLNRGDSRRKDSPSLAPIIDKGKTILIEDSDSDGDSQVDFMDILVDVGDAPALEPINLYTASMTSSTD